MRADFPILKYGISISEDFLLAQALHRAEGTQIVEIQILRVAKDAIGVGAVLHPLLLEGLHVGEGQALHLFEDVLVAVVVNAHVLGIEVSQKDAALDGAFGAHTADDGIFGNLEGSFAFRHVVDDVGKGFNGLLHLLVLRSDEGIEGIRLIVVGRHCKPCAGRISQAAGFAHLLEDDAVHATTEVLVVQGTGRFDVRTEGLLQIGEGEDVCVGSRIVTEIDHIGRCLCRYVLRTCWSHTSRRSKDH